MVMGRGPGFVPVDGASRITLALHGGRAETGPGIVLLDGQVCVLKNDCLGLHSRASPPCLLASVRK